MQILHTADQINELGLNKTPGEIFSVFNCFKSKLAFKKVEKIACKEQRGYSKERENDFELNEAVKKRKRCITFYT